MSRTENLGEGLVILPSLTDAVAGGGSSGQLIPSKSDMDARDAAEAKWLEDYLACPDTSSSFATSSVSSPPALRNDSGEAVWRLTEKALLHFASCRVRLDREAFRIELGQSRDTAGCVEGGTVEP